MKSKNKLRNPCTLGKRRREMTSKLIPMMSNVRKFLLSDIEPIKNCARRLVASPVPVMIPICEYDKLNNDLKIGNNKGTNEITPSLNK